MQEQEAEERAIRRGFISNKNSDDPPARFSDPRNLNWLPYPHTTSGQPGRFHLQRQNKVVVFPFIGRRVFRRVWELAAEWESDPFRAYSKVNLYGCTGTGKSHVLAALACLLTHESRRVVYVPDCALLLESFFIEMRGALQFAFPEYATTMDAWTDVANIREFCRAWRKQGTIYYVIDQREALDIVPDDPDKERKREVRIWLDELLARNFVAYSANAESKAHRARYGNRTDVKEIPMQGGFDEDEMSWWWKHNGKALPSLRTDEKKFIEAVTGCVPLLLRPLLKMKDRLFSDSREQFLAAEELVNVRTGVLYFHAKKSEGWPEWIERSYYKHMDACARGGFLSAPDEDLYDPRYFYFTMLNGAWQGHCLCGIAQDAIEPKLNEYKEMLKKR